MDIDDQRHSLHDYLEFETVDILPLVVLDECGAQAAALHFARAHEDPDVLQEYPSKGVGVATDIAVAVKNALVVLAGPQEMEILARMDYVKVDEPA